MSHNTTIYLEPPFQVLLNIFTTIEIRIDTYRYYIPQQMFLQNTTFHISDVFLRSRTRCLTDPGSQVRPPREVDPKFGEENGQTQKVQEEGDLRGADLCGPKNGGWG